MVVDQSILQDRTQAVRETLNQRQEVLIEMVVRCAARQYESSPGDFSIREVSSDHIVFGIQNRLIWRPDSGFKDDFRTNRGPVSDTERQTLSERSKAVQSALSRNTVAFVGMVARSASQQFEGDPGDFKLHHMSSDKLIFGSRQVKEWTPETGFN